MNLIVAVDQNWGIGCGGKLLASIPGDMAYFKEKTMGHVVVMGRKTLQSMPKHRGLAGRTNYVLTRQEDFEAERCTVVHDEEELMNELSSFDTDDVYIIGGESIYRKFYKECSRCYITKMYADLGADRFMVNLDEDEDYEITWQSEMQHENGIDYQFFLYERKDGLR